MYMTRSKRRFTNKWATGSFKGFRAQGQTQAGGASSTAVRFGPTGEAEAGRGGRRDGGDGAEAAGRSEFFEAIRAEVSMAHTHAHACTCALACTHAYTCRCLRIYTCMWVGVCECVCVRLCVCVSRDIDRCIHVCVNTYVNVHVCVNTYVNV